MKLTNEQKEALTGLCKALNTLSETGRVEKQRIMVAFDEKDKDGKVVSTERYFIKLRNKLNEDGIDTAEYRAKLQA